MFSNFRVRIRGSSYFRSLAYTVVVTLFGSSVKTFATEPPKAKILQVRNLANFRQFSFPNSSIVLKNGVNKRDIISYIKGNRQLLIRNTKDEQIIEYVSTEGKNVEFITAKIKKIGKKRPLIGYLASPKGTQFSDPPGGSCKISKAKAIEILDSFDVDIFEEVAFDACLDKKSCENPADLFKAKSTLQHFFGSTKSYLSNCLNSSKMGEMIARDQVAEEAAIQQMNGFLFTLDSLQRGKVPFKLGCALPESDKGKAASIDLTQIPPLMALGSLEDSSRVQIEGRIGHEFAHIFAPKKPIGKSGCSSEVLASAFDNYCGNISKPTPQAPNLGETIVATCAPNENLQKTARDSKDIARIYSQTTAVAEREAAALTVKVNQNIGQTEIATDLRVIEAPSVAFDSSPSRIVGNQAAADSGSTRTQSMIVTSDEFASVNRLEQQLNTTMDYFGRAASAAAGVTVSPAIAARPGAPIGSNSVAVYQPKANVVDTFCGDGTCGAATQALIKALPENGPLTSFSQSATATDQIGSTQNKIAKAGEPTSLPGTKLAGNQSPEVGVASKLTGTVDSPNSPIEVAAVTKSRQPSSETAGNQAGTQARANGTKSDYNQLLAALSSKTKVIDEDYKAIREFSKSPKFESELAARGIGLVLNTDGQERKFGASKPKVIFVDKGTKEGFVRQDSGTK